MKTLVLIAAAALLAGPAFAGGTVEQTAEAPVGAEPTPVASADWTGFYAGLSAFRGTYNDEGDSGDGNGDTDGFGIQAGYLRDFGTLVLGGELAHVSGNYEFYPGGWTSTRLKLIGGYDAGRILPYGFVGLSDYLIKETDVSDMVTIYGAGVRYAVSPRLVAGLEYVVLKKDNFAGDGFNLDDTDLSLRLDYRF